MTIIAIAIIVFKTCTFSISGIMFGCFFRCCSVCRLFSNTSVDFEPFSTEMGAGVAEEIKAYLNP